MGCGKYVRIRAKDVGRPGYHYILVGVKRRRGVRGGLTEAIGGLRLYKAYRKKGRRKRSRSRRNKVKKSVRFFENMFKKIERFSGGVM